MTEVASLPRCIVSREAHTPIIIIINNIIINNIIINNIIINNNIIIIIIIIV
jgi:hypothetical protein